MSNSQRPHGLQPTRFLHPRDFPGKSPGVGCHRLLQTSTRIYLEIRLLKRQLSYNSGGWWFSREVVSDSCNPLGYSPPGSSVHGDSPGKNTWSGLPCPPPGDLPNVGIEPRSHALQVNSLLYEPPGKPPKVRYLLCITLNHFSFLGLCSFYTFNAAVKLIFSSCIFYTC